MAIQVKHVRPGILVVADAGLRFGPGQVLEVKTLTPQLERAISAGTLVRGKGKQQTRTGSQPEGSQPETESAVEVDDSAGGEAAEAPEIDLSKLRARDAISKVEAEDDPDRLKAHLGPGTFSGPTTAPSTTPRSCSGDSICPASPRSTASCSSDWRTRLPETDPSTPSVSRNVSGSAMGK